MTYEIIDIRPKIISPDTYRILFEFLKFRHFTRYYFQIDYDWDKIKYLCKKLEQIHDLIKSDIDEFTKFLANVNKA